MDVATNQENILDKNEINILFVNYTPKNFDLTTAFLKKSHSSFNTLLATSPQQMIHELKDNDLHCIILKCQNNGKDELDLLTRVRNDHKHIPLIMCAKECKHNIAIAALNLGVNRYIQKQENTANYNRILCNAIVQEATQWLTYQQLIENERYYRDIFNSIQAGVIVHLPDGRILSVNKPAEKIFQLSNADLKTKSINFWVGRLYDEYDRPLDITEFPISKAFRTKSVIEETIGLKLRESDVMRYFLITATPQLNHNKKVVQTTSTIYEITERVKAKKKLQETNKHLLKTERKLRRSESLYRSIIDNMQDVYYRADLKGNLLMASPSGHELLGFESGSKIGKKISTEFYEKPEDRKKFLRILEKDGRVDNFEVNLKDIYGNIVTVITSSHFIYNEKGEPIGVEGIISDISKRKEAEERERFLHSVLRHDVRNKMIIINGYLDLLEIDHGTTAINKKMLNNIKKANQACIELLGKIDLLRKAEKEEKSIILTSQAIQKALDNLKDQAKAKNISIQYDSQHVTDTAVQAGVLLENIFSNIIENSIKHSNGSLIRITAKMTETQLIISMEDDGDGIDPYIRNKIFNKGYKSEKSTGTGLGLFIAKILIEFYDGEIRACRSTDLTGARFDIILDRAN